MEGIRNKVAESGIITLDPSDFRPEGKSALIDIAGQLWQGIALKEKDFRDWIKETDWSQYAERHVAVHCSVDAVIPSWAYMLIASALEPYAASIHFGDLKSLSERRFKEAIDQADMSPYQDQRIMLKGCGDAVPTGAYLYLTHRLQGLVRSLMFGEPCGAVPIYKAAKKA